MDLVKGLAFVVKTIAFVALQSKFDDQNIRFLALQCIQPSATYIYLIDQYEVTQIRSNTSSLRTNTVVKFRPALLRPILFRPNFITRHKPPNESSDA